MSASLNRRVFTAPREYNRAPSGSVSAPPSSATHSQPDLYVAQDFIRWITSSDDSVNENPDPEVSSQESYEERARKQSREGTRQARLPKSDTAEKDPRLPDFPLGSRISTQTPPEQQFMLGCLQAAVSSLGAAETDVMVIERFVDIRAWCKEYLRSRFKVNVESELKKAPGKLEEVVELMIFVLNDFYLRQQVVLDELVGKAITKWQSRRGAYLEPGDFDHTFRIPAFEVNFHESLVAWKTCNENCEPQKAHATARAGENRPRQHATPKKSSRQKDSRSRGSGRPVVSNKPSAPRSRSVALSPDVINPRRMSRKQPQANATLSGGGGAKLSDTTKRLTIRLPVCVTDPESPVADPAPPEPSTSITTTATCEETPVALDCAIEVVLARSTSPEAPAPHESPVALRHSPTCDTSSVVFSSQHHGISNPPPTQHSPSPVYVGITEPSHGGSHAASVIEAHRNHFLPPEPVPRQQLDGVPPYPAGERRGGNPQIPPAALGNDASLTEIYDRHFRMKTTLAQRGSYLRPSMLQSSSRPFPGNRQAPYTKPLHPWDPSVLDARRSKSASLSSEPQMTFDATPPSPGSSTGVLRSFAHFAPSSRRLAGDNVNALPYGYAAFPPPSASPFSAQSNPQRMDHTSREPQVSDRTCLQRPAESLTTSDTNGTRKADSLSQPTAVIVEAELTQDTTELPISTPEPDSTNEISTSAHASHATAYASAWLNEPFITRPPGPDSEGARQRYQLPTMTSSMLDEIAVELILRNQSPTPEPPNPVDREASNLERNAEQRAVRVAEATPRRGAQRQSTDTPRRSARLVQAAHRAEPNPEIRVHKKRKFRD